MLKKTRFYVGISLVVQAFSFLIMFIILWAKKKSVASAFLAVAAMGGAVGAYLLYQEKNSNELTYDSSDDGHDWFDDDGFDFDDSMINADIYGSDDGDVNNDIPKDEDASEADFQ